MLIAGNLSRGNYVYNRTSIYVYRARYKNIQSTASVTQIIAVQHYANYLFHYLFSSFSLSILDKLSFSSFHPSFYAKNVLPSIIRFCGHLMFNPEQYKEKNRHRLIDSWISFCNLWIFNRPIIESGDFLSLKLRV